MTLSSEEKRSTFTLRLDYLVLQIVTPVAPICGVFLSCLIGSVT